MSVLYVRHWDCQQLHSSAVAMENFSPPTSPCPEDLIDELGGDESEEDGE